MTQAIVSELDGMNKYLQGVKLPQALLDKKNTSYTMKNLKQDTVADFIPKTAAERGLTTIDAYIKAPMTSKLSYPPHLRHAPVPLQAHHTHRHIPLDGVISHHLAQVPTHPPPVPAPVSVLWCNQDWNT